MKSLHQRELEAKQRVMQQIEDFKESAVWFLVFVSGFAMGAWLFQMPVKNANKVKANFSKAVAKIDRKAVQFVQAVVNDAGILSKTKAPLEYGTLVNSQSQDFMKGNASYSGVLSYNTLYAGALNNPKTKWKPRPPANKQGHHVGS